MPLIIACTENVKQINGILLVVTFIVLLVITMAPCTCKVINQDNYCVIVNESNICLCY